VSTTNTPDDSLTPVDIVENFLLGRLKENNIGVLNYFEDNKQTIVDDFALAFVSLYNFMGQEEFQDIEVFDRSPKATAWRYSRTYD